MKIIPAQIMVKVLQEVSLLQIWNKKWTEPLSGTQEKKNKFTS